MSAAKPKLLIVDDEPSLRSSLAAILSRAGYDIRSAHDGFSALSEVRRDCPDLILSDLNMPGMSGFELLSVIRRTCPAVRVVAMSGAFRGSAVPPGLAADAFYEKGTNLALLLETLATLATAAPAMLDSRLDQSAPLWVSSNSNEHLQEISSIMLCCPDCLRAFSLPLGVSAQLIRTAHCTHCSAPVNYAVVESLLPPMPVPVRHLSGEVPA